MNTGAKRWNGLPDVASLTDYFDRWATVLARQALGVTATPLAGPSSLWAGSGIFMAPVRGAGKWKCLTKTTPVNLWRQALRQLVSSSPDPSLWSWMKRREQDDTVNLTVEVNDRKSPPDDAA
jgi:hypothetical protein